MIATPRPPCRSAAAALALALAAGAPARAEAAPQRPGAADASGATPFVDAHTHLEPGDPRRSVEAALRAMPVEGAVGLVFLPPPFTSDAPGRYDADLLLPAVRGRPARLAVLGGGGTLNPMIHDAVRTGEAGPEVLRRFRAEAERLLRAGVAGFGELAALHFEGATPYQSAPPDHPLFLLLAEIAAEHGVPIVLHMEAVPRQGPLPGAPPPPRGTQLVPNVDGLERLLAHAPGARIVWAHAGWDATGARTPALCRRLLRAHPNLSMDVKIDPARPGRNPPLVRGATVAIDPEWLRLFSEFPDRFVVGTDQHYPEPPAGPQRWEGAVELLERLPPELRRKIGTENAARLFPTLAGASPRGAP